MDGKVLIAGHTINIQVSHIKFFKTKELFVKSLVKDLESLNIPTEELESALGDTYDIYVPPKEKKEK